MTEPTAGDDMTLREVLRGFEERGYTGQFAARDDATLECFTCRQRVKAAEAKADALHRLEGASDPADMLAVLALACPACGARGTAVLNYGPEATPEDAEVLREI